MVVAVQHFDVWSLRLVSGLRRGPAANRFNIALDLAVVVVVAVLSIALNIVPAVFIGVAIAIALFAFRMSRSLVRRSYRCGAIHSRKSRTDSERAFLERAGDAILVMELQGALFFGAGEKMLSDIAAALQRETSSIILDLRRLTEIDSTGASAVVELKSELAGRQKELLLVGGNTMALDRLQNLGALASIEDADILPDVDRAIERAEDDLLRAEPRLHHTEVSLTTVGLFAGFGQSEFDAIEPLLRRARYEKGSVIFREGDSGDELLIVTHGTASAYLQLPQMNVRLASFAPGTMFGELALLDEGPRSATVIADEELVCYALSKANFAVLAAKAPAVAIRLVAAIGRELSGRLRGANRTIHQLEA